MKIKLSILLLTFVFSFSFAVNDELLGNLWDLFKKTHRKSYLSIVDEFQRKEIFRKNVERIEKHNDEYAMGLHKYTLGINHFTDMTFDEFKSKYLGYSANMTQFKQGSTYSFLKLPTEIQIPGSIDWRSKNAVTGVKNQGQCGSCWSFSATGALEGAHARLTGKLASLSEQQLVDCSGKYGNQGCDGGLMDSAFKYVQENGGIESENSYPYEGVQKTCRFKSSLVVATCTGYADIPTQDELALQQAVAIQGPISVAIDATEENFMLYKSGIFYDNTCSNDPDKLDHGVLVVGYGSGLDDDGKNADYWIVKNSWGPEWGEGGYIRMARNHKNMCGIATQASYPLVK